MGIERESHIKHDLQLVFHKWTVKHWDLSTEDEKGTIPIGDFRVTFHPCFKASP